MNTHAGAKSSEWWEELAEVLGENGSVTFSVDGLEDTTLVHRQYVQWDKVVPMKAFIGAGGRARWDYLVFKHNEHQVEEAERFAEDLGFEEFNAKRSSRLTMV